MADILKHIRYPGSNKNDPNGNLLGIDSWSEQEAIRRADEIGIELTENRWDIVLFVRDYFRGRGTEATAREIMTALEDEYAQDGGKRWLYRQFPGGPVYQASLIAGVPIPDGTINPSFGSVH